MPTHDSGELVQAWLGRGDEYAATELYRRMQPLARAVAAGFPALRSELDDAVQQIVIRAFAALPRFDRTRPLGPWLRTLALRHCLNRRGALLRQSIVWCDEVTSEACDPAPGPDATLVAAEFQHRLGASLARLPAADRALLDSADEFGPDHRRSGAQRVRAHRARARLREILARTESLPLAA